MCHFLTYWSRNKMAVIFHMTFSNAFFNENLKISIKISPKFLPKGIIYNIPFGEVTSHYLNQWWLGYWRIYASLGLYNLIMCHSFIMWSYWKTLGLDCFFFSFFRHGLRFIFVWQCPLRSAIFRNLYCVSSMGHYIDTWRHFIDT